MQAEEGAGGPDRTTGDPPGASGDPPGTTEDPPGARFGCASFNQDSTSLAVSTHSGYKLFSLTSVEKLECVHESDIPDVVLVERLFSSSLVVVVRGDARRCLNVFHFRKRTEICSSTFPEDILSVRLNRQRLVVCLQHSIYVHSVKDMKLLETLSTPPNPSGLCALSINHSKSFLAFPGNASVGDVTVFDANKLVTVTTIAAHHSPLAALTFDPAATKLASASERGTVIRVFSIPDGLRLFEFRRGMKRYVTISCLSFSPDAQFLCASSNTETVHIFRLEQLTPSGPDSVSWSAYVGRVLSAASSLLPAPVSGVMSQDRAFATVHLVASGRKNVCTLATIQKIPRLLVATADGELFVYDLHPQDGGECALAYKHRLFDEDQGAQTEGSEVTQLTATGPSYAATVASPACGVATATLTGYSEEGGAKRGELLPEHEFAIGPVCLDDENEFPPINWCRDGTGGVQGGRW